jgi:membrane protease YdiL (CAAX protease family)
LPRDVVPVGLALTAALFSLCHARFGWRQVAAKTPLSVAALACVLVSHSLLPALIAHGAFNVDTWRERRRRSDSGLVAMGGRRGSQPAPWRLP